MTEMHIYIAHEKYNQLMMISNRAAYNFDDKGLKKCVSLS